MPTKRKKTKLELPKNSIKTNLTTSTGWKIYLTPNNKVVAKRGNSIRRIPQSTMVACADGKRAFERFKYPVKRVRV